MSEKDNQRATTWIIKIGAARAGGYLLNILLDAMKNTEFEQRLDNLEQIMEEISLKSQSGIKNEIN